MGWIYRHILRPGLFRQDPERAHNVALAGLGLVARTPGLGLALESFLGAPPLPVRAFGLEFPNPVGLAAGMDKFATAVPVWEKMGFGFAELGGVTWRAQPGNPPPRMFRAVADGAIVNRMGFNNPGAEIFARKLSAWKQAGRWPRHPIGINLGKSKDTPLEQAAGDYASSFRQLRELADFFVVNVSSPNTPNLRQLQDKGALDEIFAALQESQDTREGRAPKPILVKVAPDLSFEALDEILELAGPRQLAGIVATNTTVQRPATGNATLQKVYAETGGLSGKPVRARSTEIIRHLYRQTGGRLPIVGVGGIASVDDAWEKVLAGATLLQVYTGLVYEGPALPRALVEGLRERLATSGFASWEQAVGSQARE
jgi:dihydroorotate dehydrogenase